MQYALLLPIMIFLHIIDDFVIQNVLAKMKQKSWWEDQTKHMDSKHRNLYKWDWTIALIAHAFEWSFMIMLPIMAYSWDGMDEYHTLLFMVYLVGNTIIHADIDHFKANLLVINLVTDQSCHILQIVLTWLMWLLLS